jgi:hypothetical protein
MMKGTPLSMTATASASPGIQPRNRISFNNEAFRAIESRFILIGFPAPLFKIVYIKYI